MKALTHLLIVICCFGLASGFAQQTVSGSHSRASVSGIVTRDPDGEPVKKALIELIADNQAEGGDYTAVTGADGTFRIENVIPGRYHLFAERTGYLDSEKVRTRADGRVVTLKAGQEVDDLHIRVQAAAVVRGRVTDEDGDPMPDAQVTVLRQTFASGHSRWEQAGGVTTNDLGEYRIANLPPGNFYVSVSPPPDLKTLIETAGKTPPNEKPSTSYQTTYYPGTPDRSQAAPVQLHPGDDFPVNFSLTPAPSLSIRGAVVNLPPHTTATIMMQSRDFNVIQSGAEIKKDGSFVIRDVSPGSYTIVASVDGSPIPMTARQTVQVGSTNVDGVRLAPQAGAVVRGRLRVESRGAVQFDATRIFLTLQNANSEDDTGAVSFGYQFDSLAHVLADGSFEWRDIPAGNYYVQLMGETGASEDWFLKSVYAGGREVNDSGLNVSGSPLTLDVVISANGGVAEGVAIDSKSQPVPNTVVVAVPEARLRGRMDHYHKTVTDQSGHFMLHGLRPGEYTVYAWESVDGDAYSNPDFLRNYEGQGSALHVGEGERKSLQVKVIPTTDDQP